MGDNLDLEKIQAPIMDNPGEGDDAAKLERYKQQIEGSRQEAIIQRTERINEWTELLSDDVNNLVRLQKVKDSKLVSEVMTKFGYSSLEEALEENGLTKKEIQQTNGMTKEELEKWYEDRKAQDIHQIAIQEAEKSFKDLNDEEKEVAKRNFQKITKGQTLTIDEAKEYANMAALYAIKDKVIQKGDKGQGLVNLAGVGLGKSSGEKGKDVIDSIIANW